MSNIVVVLSHSLIYKTIIVLICYEHRSSVTNKAHFWSMLAAKCPVHTRHFQTNSRKHMVAKSMAAKGITCQLQRYHHTFANAQMAGSSRYIEGYGIVHTDKVAATTS